MKNGKELLMVILLAIAVRLPWLLMIPQAEAPDENMHRWLVDYISNHMSLPDQQTVIQTGIEAAYASVPPFGYLPHIILHKLFPIAGNAQLIELASRLGSLLMSLVVVGCAWWMGRKLFSKNHLAAIAVPLLVIFHPQFVFTSCYVNNDITAAAISALIIVNIILVFEKGLSLKRTVYLSILLSWLILCKYSALPVLLITLLALSAIVYLAGADRPGADNYVFVSAAPAWHNSYALRPLSPRPYGQIGLLLILVALMTSWWFIRNYYTFAGDILGVKTMNSLWAITYHQQTYPDRSPLAIIFSGQFWRMLFFSFWGWFGYMTRSLPRIIYYGYLFFVLLACGNAMAKWRSIKNATYFPYLILFSFCLLINIAACVYCCFAKISGPQGRYLFPSEIPIMAMLVYGLTLPNKKWSTGLVIALVTFNFFIYTYSTFYLCHIYCHI